MESNSVVCTSFFVLDVSQTYMDLLFIKVLNQRRSLIQVFGDSTFGIQVFQVQQHIVNPPPV